MADPFSIIAGTAGLLDVCVRVTKYLRNVHASAKEISQELGSLLDEVSSLEEVDQIIQNLWLQHGKDLDLKDAANSRIIDQWSALQTSLQYCQSTIESFDEEIQKAIGSKGVEVQGYIDGVKKVLRKHSKDGHLREFRTRLMGNRDNLQLLLQVLNFSYSQNAQAAIGRSIYDVSDEVRVQGFKVQQTLAILLARTDFMATDHFQESISEARRAVSAVKLNKYFHPPQAVNSLYVGRESMLDTLQRVLLGDRPDSQRRFVICGYGGSGKTELCSKFAQDNRNRFWGVFSINGSSVDSIRRGFAAIAKIAQLGEESYSSGKNWLTNLELPWLLIIDNADDAELDLNEHFPPGERGVVLVTTRVSKFQVLGTTEPGFFDLGQEKLSKNESNELLLRAAKEPQRTESVWQAAARIARHLGYLPLALIHAGCSILKRVGKCTLWNYIEVYERSWTYIRKKINLAGSQSRITDEGIINLKVFSTIEIPFRGLQHTMTLPAQDAVDLLKIFSFFSSDNIRFDVLTTAIAHARQQREHEQKKAVEATHEVAPFWSTFKRRAFMFYLGVVDRSAPTLPYVLREEDYEYIRLTEALDKLETLALINSNENGSYWMHPLVNYWVREQPDMKTAEQALWCDVAGSILSQSILLPPLDTIPTSEALKSHLVPHIERVVAHKQSICTRLAENRKKRRSLFRALEFTPTKQFAIDYIKFSLIYFKNGLLENAAKLQCEVLDYVSNRYGDDNEVAWRVKLFLAQNYKLQTKANQAAELQVAVLKSRERILGPEHIETLRCMTELGATRNWQTRFQESKELLEKAIDGLTRTLGSSGDDTLIAKIYLGGTMYMFFDIPACVRLYKEAYEGLRKSEAYGPTHPQTLDAGEELAVAQCDLPDPDFDAAYKLALEVKRERKRQCGTQHPLALKSRLWLARVVSAKGDNAKAEKMMRKHLPVAEANLGQTHLGTLAGHLYLAVAIARQKRYEEAEEKYLYLTDRKMYASSVRADGDHADRLNALRHLLRMYVEWDRYDKALDVCDEIYDSASKVGGKGLGLQHRIIKWMESIRQEVLRKKGEEEETARAEFLREQAVPTFKSPERVDSGIEMLDEPTIDTIDNILGL